VILAPDLASGLEATTITHYPWGGETLHSVRKQAVGRKSQRIPTGLHAEQEVKKCSILHGEIAFGIREKFWD